MTSPPRTTRHKEREATLGPLRGGNQVRGRAAHRTEAGLRRAPPHPRTLDESQDRPAPGKVSASPSMLKIENPEVGRYWLQSAVLGRVGSGRAACKFEFVRAYQPDSGHVFHHKDVLLNLQLCRTHKRFHRICTPHSTEIRFRTPLFPSHQVPGRFRWRESLTLLHCLFVFLELAKISKTTHRPIGPHTSLRVFG